MSFAEPRASTSRRGSSASRRESRSSLSENPQADAVKLPLHPENKKVLVAGRPSATVASLRSQLEAALEKIQEQDGQIEEMSMLVEHLENELSGCKEQLLEAERIVVESGVASNVPDDQIDHVLLADALKQIKDRLDHKTSALTSALQEVDVLNSMIEHLKNLHDKTREDNAAMKVKIIEQNKEIAHTKSILMAPVPESGTEEEINEYRRRIASLSNAIEEHQDELCAQRDRISAKENEAQIIRDELDANEREAEAMIAELDAQNRAAKNRCNELTEEFAKQEAQSQKLQDDIDAKNLELQALRDELSAQERSSQMMLADLRVKDAEARAKLDSRDENRQREDAERESRAALERQLIAELESRVQMQNDMLADLKEELHEVMNENRLLIDANTARDDQLAALVRENNVNMRDLQERHDLDMRVTKHDYDQRLQELQKTLNDVEYRHREDLRSMTDDWKLREREYMDAVKDGHANSSQVNAEHLADVAALKTESEVAKAQHALEMSHLTAEMDRLRTEHATELEGLTNNFNAEVEGLRAQHASEVESMTSTAKAEMEALLSSHAEMVDELNQEHSATLERLNTQHVNELDTNNTAHADAMEECMAKHAAEMEELHQSNEARLAELAESHAQDIETLEKGHAEALEALEQRLQKEFEETRAKLEHAEEDVEILSKKLAQYEDLEALLEESEIELSEMKAMNRSLVDEIEKRQAWRHKKENEQHPRNSRPPFKPPSVAAEAPRLGKLPPAPFDHAPVLELTFTAPPQSYARYIPQIERTSAKKKRTGRKPTFEPKAPPQVPAPGKNPRYSHVRSRTDTNSGYAVVAAVNASSLGGITSGFQGEGVRKLSAVCVPSS
eukprot:m.188499 g.188499  ORF g.188499 m.188499 type:complete len:853 (+) comp17440_c0_seq1:57-2615(+)